MIEKLKFKLYNWLVCRLPQPKPKDATGLKGFWYRIKPFFYSCAPIRIAILILILLAVLTSCAVVPTYDRAYLNDEEMRLEKMSCAEFQAYFNVIREGASGADGGKTGGGCGCN